MKFVQEKNISGGSNPSLSGAPIAGVSLQFDWDSCPE